jgi:CubicO group peptidase (beta-lactamase class C family)
MVATVIHLLAERGKLRYDDRVADYWPEFAANGKQEITIRQILNHTAGIPQMPAGLGHAEICNWDRICSEIARLKPLWKPGTRMRYHAITYGWILGEVARRADGRIFSRILKEDVCEPLGIQDLFVGIDDEAEPRVAWLENTDTEPVPPDADSLQAVPSWLRPLHAWMNRPDARRACIPASNGIMNARSIARHYAALLPGGVDGIELLPPERVRVATELQRLDNVQDEDLPMRMGLGYAVLGKGTITGGWAAPFGAGGTGGSIGFADLESRFAFGLTKNLHSPEWATFLIIEELWKILQTSVAASVN